MACHSPQFSEPGDISYLQRQGKRRSWHVHPNQVSSTFAASLSDLTFLLNSVIYKSFSVIEKRGGI
nr:unnamed protein product [Callosobruchus analis]